MSNILRGIVQKIELAAGVGGVAISAGTNSATSGTVTFSNSNGISFGMNPFGVITASVAAGAGGVALSAGTNSFSSGTISFSNANNISFGMDTNSNVTASYSQSVQTEGWSAVGQTTGSTSSTTFNSNFSISGSGGVSVGFSGQTIQIAAPATSALSYVAVGNTTGSTSSTTFQNAYSISGASGASVGFSGNTIIVSAGAGGGAAFSAGVSNIGNTAGTTGTVSNQILLAGQGAVTLSQSTAAGGATVSISVPAQTVQTEGWSAVGNTTGSTTSTSFNSNFSLSGAGIASVGYSGNTIIISASSNQSVQTEGWSAVGNTTGSTSSTSFNSNFSISGAGIVSAGYSGNTIIISATTAAQTVQTEGWTAVGNTTGSTSSTSFNSNFSLSGSGGASVGFSGQTIQIAAPATSAESWYAAGNTTASTSSTTFQNNFTISGSGGASVGYSGQTIIIDAPVAGAATLTITASLNNGLGTTSSGTIAGSNLVISAAGALSAGLNANTLVLSAPVQSVQTEGWSAVGNTTGSTSSTSFNSNFSISGSGGASVGFSGQTIQIAAPTGILSITASGNTTTSSSSSTINQSNLVISGAGNLSVGLSNNTLILSGASAGATQSWSAVGATTASTSSTSFGANVSLSGTGGVSVGFSGQTIIISGPGAGGATLSNMYFPVGIETQCLTSGSGKNVAIASNALLIQRILVPQNLSISRGAVILNINIQTSAAAGSSGSWSATLGMGIYTRNGTSYSTVLTSSAALSTGWTSNAAATTWAAGEQLITVPLATLLTPNEYWIMLNLSTVTSGAQLSATQSIYCLTNALANNQFSLGNLGGVYGQSLIYGQGSTTTSSYTLPTNLGFLTSGTGSGPQAFILQLNNYSIW